MTVETTLRPHWRSIELPAPRGRLVYRTAKRVLDIGLGSLLLLLLVPFALVVVAAIRLDSPGPAFFQQERVGSRRCSSGRAGTWVPTIFTLHKLRTMVHGAAPSVHVERVERYVRGETADGRGPAYKPEDDPRITRVGRVLRAWSVDELPQLLNVVRGEMSLVGPRPVPAYEADNFSPEHLHRFATRPGMTGLWQVSGRSELSFEEAVAHDLDYVARQSMALDLRILFRTMTIVLRRRGAA